MRRLAEALGELAALAALLATLAALLVLVWGVEAASALPGSEGALRLQESATALLGAVVGIQCLFGRGGDLLVLWFKG